MYRIGAFSALTGLTIKALRYYDEIGLLRPAHVDRSTRYRYYEADQMADANRLLALREAGVLLAEADASLAESIELARRRIADRVEGDRRLLAKLDALVESEFPVVLKDQPPMCVATLTATLHDYDDVDSLLGEVLSMVPRADCGLIHGSLWQNCTGQSVQCTAFVQVLDQSVAVRGRAQRARLAPTRVASLVIDGTDRGAFARGYKALHSWLHSRGLSLRGPKAELYLASFESGSNAITDVRFPII